MALHITACGLEVRAPFAMPIEEIDHFVKSKENWINKHFDETAQNRIGHEHFSIGYGDKISFRGSMCPIIGAEEMEIAKLNRIKGRYLNGEFLIPENLSSENIKFILSRILKREAENHIPQRVHHYAALMGLNPDSVRITTAFGRWGSCSARKRLNFAWMLMMADEDAIDSVVIHELAHMVNMNHSAEFYKLVRAYCPDYKRQRQKLNALGRRIDREGWKR
jgi:predicted metal-dependent hydrolase